MRAIVSLEVAFASFSFADVFCASCPKLGRTIVIKDTAFVTYIPSLINYYSLLTSHRFHAFIVYLYTREIKFGTPNRASARSGYSPGMPLPSAKSIYRLADKVICCDFLLRVFNR